MSMIGNFRALPEEELQALFADPARVEQLLYESFFGGTSDGNGSAWEGSFPLGFIVAGGREIGDDLGYGPARGLTSQEVHTIDAALEPLASDELRRRFDADRMTELQVYPFGWSHDPDGELEYLLEYYAELRGFVRRAAERGHALLVYLS
jgi:hypothetical protein